MVKSSAVEKFSVLQAQGNHTYIWHDGNLITYLTLATLAPYPCLCLCLALPARQTLNSQLPSGVQIPTRRSEFQYAATGYVQPSLP